MNYGCIKRGGNLKPWLVYSAVGLILFFSFSLKAQNIEVDPSYVTDRWTINEGLPVNNVVDILQSKNGYLWLATFDGLVRFDGVTFTVYQSEQYPGLPSNRIIALQEAQDGSIWMKMQQGFLVYYKEGRFYHVGEESELNPGLVNEFYMDSEEKLWIATTNGIYVYDGDKLTRFRQEEIQGNIEYIFVDQQEGVWYKVFNEDELIRISPQEIQRFSYPQRNFQQNIAIYEEQETGIIWLSIISDVYQYKDGELIYHSTVEGETAVIGFMTDLKGTLWAVNEIGKVYTWDEKSNTWIYKLNGISRSEKMESFKILDRELWIFGRQKFYRDGNQILSSTGLIYCFLFDREDNLWVGTRNMGLFRLKKNLFKTYNEDDGVQWNNVYAIIEDYKSEIWAGTYRGGVGVIDSEGNIDSVGIENTAYGGYITSLFMGQDSTIYAGSIGAGLSWISPAEKKFHKERNTGTKDPIQIKGFYEEENGELWLGTPNGLFRGSVGNWKKVENQRFDNFRVRMITEAPDGSLWLGTNGSGIARYNKGEFTFYGKNEGFISNLFRSFHITDVSSVNDYILWVGSEDLGLIRVEVADGEPNLQTLTRYGTQIGMLDYAIHSIQDDDFGYFWMNTNRGIYRVAKSQLEQYHRGEINQLKGISFTESDGLMNREGNGGSQSPGITASDGRIWFANQAGAVAFNPADFVEVENESIPPVVIEEIQTNDSTIYIYGKSEVELSKQERGFEIRFTALSLVAPDKNNFRYRLVGIDEEWRENDGRRSAVYTNIPEGTYRFEVMASNNTGKWNPQPASLAIIIAPYFYETAWFNFIIFVLIAVSIVGGYRWRIRSLKFRELKLKKLVAERTRDLQKEKEKTQEQADRLKELDEAKTRFFTNISHELRTPLTLIMSPLKQIIAEKEEEFDEKTKEEFSRMLRNCDRLLRLIDQTLELTRLEKGKQRLKVSEVELNKFLDDLVNLFLFIGKEKNISIKYIAFPKPINIFVDFDKLDKIVANLLSNAIKFTNPVGEVTVSLIENEDHVEIKVKDSGIGISKEDIEKIFDRFFQVDSSETRMHEGSGVGLSLAKDFTELHHGDLLLESEKGKGSEFTISLKKGTGHFSEDDFEETPQQERKSRPGINGNGYSISENEETDVAVMAEDRTTVLVVEDNADMRNFIKKILVNDYRVITASNGEEGVRKVSESLPDLIIADIMMPKMDGLSFNRNLKQDPITASIPIIFLTAKTTKENRIKGFEEGGDAYLNKPFDPTLLKARIQNLLKIRYRLRNELAEHTQNSKQNVKRVDPFIRSVLEVLDEHYMDPDFNVSQLAGKLYIDRSHLLRKLKSSVNLSPSEFIKKYRMEKAAELLKSDYDNISEVAYAIGFKSLSYFSYSFKEYFEMSPSVFLSQQKEEEPDA